MEFTVCIYLRENYTDVRKIRPGKCDFRSNRDEPIGTLVDQFDTNHENPQFIVMVN